MKKRIIKAKMLFGFAEQHFYDLKSRSGIYTFQSVFSVSSDDDVFAFCRVLMIFSS